MGHDELLRRKVRSGIVVQDPDGLDVEIVLDPENAVAAFASPQGVSFRTGSQGMGHIVIATADAARGVAFYSTLGFAVSDYIDVNLGPGLDARVVFMHCNERHHSLALLPLPVPVRLNHLMLEASSVDHVLEAYYRAQSAGVPIMRHMGRHTNDHMLSFYSQTPGGFDVEFGCEGRPVGPDWKVGVYDAISLWGHHS
jgi:2,3-dihydroxybiphenyl 1,2-dioxygenase